MGKVTNDRKKRFRRQNLIQLVLSLVLIILLNVISYFLFTRIDLTAEKRYSLSPATRAMLRELDDVVYFRIYLEGEFPAGFKRLRNETREMLDEFRAYTDNIQYEFIDPAAIKNEKDRNNPFRQLMAKGLQPTDLQVRDEGSTSRQIIFPGALVTYNNSEVPVQLLNSQMNTAPETVLNNSIQDLEYNLASAIQKLTAVIRPSVAFVEGHGEWDKMQVADITYSLGEFYTLERVRIDGNINSLTDHGGADTAKVSIRNKFAAIIIAGPDSVFSEKDKFIIDQYVMHGGKVLWLVDAVTATMDSLQTTNQTVGIAANLRLGDMFFKYGFRLNEDLVMDLNACPIPIRTGQIGNQPQFEFYPWYYFPILSPASGHPVVTNLNGIRSEFVSSIDTVQAEGLKRAVLLSTSSYSRRVKAPAYISLDILREKPDRRLFAEPGAPVAILAEGRFTSLYQRHVPPEISDDKALGFREESKPTRMIVVSDADAIRNGFDKSRGVPLPLGFDRYTRQTFGNKDFILNAVNYLCDDSGLLSVRARELKLRLLDNTKLTGTKLRLQIVNVALPVIIVLAFALAYAWLRRKRWTSVN